MYRNLGDQTRTAVLAEYVWYILSGFSALLTGLEKLFNLNIHGIKFG